MTDVYGRRKRSEIMRAIRSSGNRSTEQALARLMRHAPLRGWRRGLALPGQPDFAFPARRLAVFVDGCFWHGCREHGGLPKSNRAFWRRKIAANRRRDASVGRALRRAGWSVIRIWEHDVDARAVARLRRILA